MKILHLVSEKTWGGGEQQVAYLVETCLQQNIPSYVACRHNSAFHKFCIKRDIPHFSLPFKNEFDIYTAWKIKRFCRKKQINIMHVHSGKTHGIAIISHILGSKTPIILSRRIYNPIRDNFFVHYKYNHAAIKKVICVSDAIKCLMQNELSNKEKCITIFSGIDTNKFNAQKKDYLQTTYGLSNNEFKIGTIAALVWCKGLHTFIKSAEAILQQGFPARFFIIGEGYLRTELQDYITQRGLENSIHLTGFLPNINEVLPELNVFTLTSSVEGLGTSILDAMACQVPVVATATGGVPQIVVHEKTGLLAPIGDETQIASHIMRICNDPILRKKITENASQHLNAHFLKEHMTSATIEEYRSVLST